MLPPMQGHRMMMGSSSMPSLHMAGPSMQDAQMQAAMMQAQHMQLQQQQAMLAQQQMQQQQMALMPMQGMMPMQAMHMADSGAVLTPGRITPSGRKKGGGGDSQHKELMSAHGELIEMMKMQCSQHMSLMKAHSDLMNHVAKQGLGGGAGGKAGGKPKKQNPALGVVRLDYNYPPAEGDIDCPGSFGYDVFYRCVPGLTFEMAQAGKFTEEVERNFAEAIKYLEARNVSAMTGDCGFMMAFQVKARQIASKPIFMSSMVQCPVIATAFEPQDQILIMTANGNSLRSQKDMLLNSCGFDVNEDRFVIVGCQDVPGFDAVAKGEAVPLSVVQPGVVKKVLEVLKARPRIAGILMECTELPPYSDAVRAATELPVWDAITGCDFYVNGFKDNPRMGINDWQDNWDQEQDEYAFGDNLIAKDKQDLKNKVDGVSSMSNAKAKKKPSKKQQDKIKKKLAKKQNPVLGVVRLDYNYPPAPGDIDCPGSYGYDVIFRVVPGMTFAMAMSGHLSFTVEKEFRAAVTWLEKQGAVGITGDCGFMMAFQPLARQVANIPVFMSSMVQCPMISVAFDKYDKIIILTANSETLKPQKDALLNKCGFDVDDTRFIIYGCQNVPGFDAVAKGEAVDVEYVTPGIVKMVKDIIKKDPTIRAILSECTELPPYSDALRQATNLPVWDSITCADFFISAFQDNPRFGLNEWQNPWDGTADEYKWGENLTAEQKSHAKNF